MNERELLERCLDGSATAEERDAVLRDARLRRELASHVRLEAGLRATLSDDRANLAAIVSDLQGASAADTVEGIRRQIAPREVPRTKRPARMLYWLAPLAAAAAVVIALWAPWSETKKPEWSAGLKVKTGDVLAPRAGETVVAQMDDGSMFALSGPANLIVGRTLRLQEGKLVVRAAKHPANDPLVVLTPHGRTEVVGTEFTLAAGADTKLSVDEGTVRFVPNGGSAQMLGAGKSAAATVAARDPIHQPFASDSQWNRSLGSGAKFEALAGVDASRGAHVETREWSVPIFVARAGDPQRRLVYRSLRTEAGRVRVDPSALLTGRDDNFLALVDENLSTVWEMYGTSLDESGAILSADITPVNLRGSGWGLEGVNHAGASILGGLIRKGELRHGTIPHALAVQVPAAVVNKTGGPFEWPSHRGLSSWHRYGTNGNVRLGTLLAIPPDVDLAALKLSPSARAVARALQDYGAYVIGTFNGGMKPFVFVAESACNEDVSESVIAEVSRLAPLLRRVSNNSAQSVGGGGTPRQPAPPPLVTQGDFSN